MESRLLSRGSRCRESSFLAELPFHLPWKGENRGARDTASNKASVREEIPWSERIMSGRKVKENVGESKRGKRKEKLEMMKLIHGVGERERLFLETNLQILNSRAKPAVCVLARRHWTFDLGGGIPPRNEHLEEVSIFSRPTSVALHADFCSRNENRAILYNLRNN